MRRQTASPKRRSVPWRADEGEGVIKGPDTVGEFKSAEMSMPHMPAWKAKTLGKLTREKVLLEL